MRLRNINKILITGLPRTGTTFFGNFLGSAQNVEYFFEPPMMPLLLNCINSVDRAKWIQLFEGYCLDELLSQSIAGRRLNFNRGDDSFVYKFKDREEIEDRLKKSFRSSELESIIDSYTFAFKTPGVTEAISQLQELYPEWQVVVVFRKYEDVLASIVTKGWFDDSSPHQIKPSEKIGTSLVPLNVDEKWKTAWPELSVIERSIVYMNTQLVGTRKIKNPIRLNYDEFVSDPEVLLTCFERLNMEPTQETNELIASIRTRENDNRYLLDGVSSHLLAEVEALKCEFQI